MCPRCGQALHRSRYEQNQAYKSCPRCSVIAGVHVYYRYEHFGMRDMGGGHVIIQSYCPDCRAGGDGGQPLFECPQRG